MTLIARILVVVSSFLASAVSPALAEKASSGIAQKNSPRTEAAIIKAREFQTLEAWIIQLNASMKILWEYQNPHELRESQIPLAARLVYGMDDQIKKLTSSKLSGPEQTRLDRAMNGMSHRAFYFYQQHSMRWREQQRRTRVDTISAEDIRRLALAADQVSATPKVDVVSKAVLQPNERHVIPFFAGFDSPEKCTDHPHEISDEDIEYGQQQVRRMVHDRPAMATYVKEGDPIWNWCARQYAGEFTRARFYWNPDDYDPDGSVAWHTMKHDAKLGTITVGQRYEMSRNGDELWSAAVFELFNIRNDQAFEAWRRHAMFGKMSQDELVIQWTHLEYCSGKLLASFYRNYWLPQAKLRHLKVDGRNWKTDMPSTYEEWFKQIPKDSSYLKHYTG